VPAFSLRWSPSSLKQLIHTSFAFGLFLAGACATVSTRDALELQYRFEVGQSYRTLMVSEHDISQTIMGQVQDVQTSNSIGIRTTVVEVDAGGSALVRMVYESFKMSQQSPAGSVEYDSFNPPDPVPDAARPYAAMVGSEFTMRISPQGRMTDVQGMEAMMDRIMETSNVPAGPMMEQVRGSVDQMMEGMWSGFSTLPAEPIMTGDSWESNPPPGGGLPLNFETTLTLVGRRNGVAMIEMHVIMGEGDSTMEIGPMTLRYDVVGEQTGTMEIDEATGWPLRSRLEGGFSGTIEMEGLPGLSRSIPMVSHSLMTLERLPGG
jgi:uncharacterized protein DUF6263